MLVVVVVVDERHPVARRARHASEYLNMVVVLQGCIVEFRKKKRLESDAVGLNKHG